MRPDRWHQVPPIPTNGPEEMTEADMIEMAGEENHDCHWARTSEYAALGCGLCALEKVNKGLEGIRADLQKISNGG